MERSLLKWEMAGIVFISLLGAFLHFAYELSGEMNLVAALAAVNESVWEHLKIAFSPALVYAIIEHPFLKGKTGNFLIAKAAGIYLMPITIAVLFYSYSTAIGHNILAIDIAIFIAAIAIGQLVSCRVLVAGQLVRWLNILGLVALVVLACAFVLFTFVPPDLPIFRDPTAGTYTPQQTPEVDADGDADFAETSEPETYPHNYWSHTELPQMTMSERIQVALAARAKGEEYVREHNAKAQELSDRLEDYIRQWLKGEVPAKLPKGLLPEYIDNPKTRDWTLMRPEDVLPEKQWLVIPCHEVDPEFKRLYMLGTDPHVTYAKLIFVAPVGSQLVVEGDFPHARYMSYEILPPFDPRHPATGTMGETPEVLLVDVDIEPDPGNINPFRVGADRTAPNRHYHVTFDLMLGNAVALNPEAMKSPEYRAPGNRRVGGPFGFAGPWGNNVFTPSVLWLRIYAPDKNTDIYGGVPLPRAVLQLKTGEKFWLQPDFSLALERETTLVSAGSDVPREPYDFIGPQQGWFKIFGLTLLRFETAGYIASRTGTTQTSDQIRENIRRMFLLLFNRGEAAEPPGNYEGCATACKNINYLTRIFQLGPGTVYVITGKKPKFPRTRNGEAVMTCGEVRYWSISQYGRGEDDKYETAVNYGSLMDDEVVLNEDDEYIIVYSTPGKQAVQCYCRERRHLG